MTISTAAVALAAVCSAPLRGGDGPDPSGWSPLMTAVERGDAARVRELLAAGADVDYSTPTYGFTALMEAVYRGDAGIAALLIEAGADPDARTRRGYAVSEDSPLLLAVKTGSPGLARMLLSAGAAVNRRYQGGRTALLYAVSYGNPEVVEVLLAHGADPSARDDEGLGVEEWNALGPGSREGGVSTGLPAGHRPPTAEKREARE